MANKITIIGAGQVGSTIAFELTVKGIASEVVLIDIDTKRAMGEAMDIRQGTPFLDPVNIHDGSYEDAKNSDVVIVTSGVARKPGQTRLDLAQTNVNIMKSIIPQITKAAPDAIYIIVANPVDILTYQFVKTSGIPSNRIIGSGTMLDTARLRARIAELYQLAQHNVQAYVFGEHGDSSFVPWSLANVATIPVDKYHESFAGKDFQPINHEEVETYVRKSGGVIIEAKRCTNYAIAATTSQLCDCINNATDTTLTVSSMMNGEYGISDVCLSILSVVGRNGLTGRLITPLTDVELAALRHSADCLKATIEQLEF